MRLPSFRLYLYSHDLKIVGKSDFNADGHVSALNVADRIYRCCPDTCISYELWAGPDRISSPHFEDRVVALNRYEQQVVVDTEIALRDSWTRIRESKNLLSALEELQQQTSK